MPKQANAKQYKISPQEYQHILRGIDFNSISLTALEYRCDITRPVPEARLSLNKTASIKSQVDGLATVSLGFDLRGELDNAEVLVISGEYILSFSYKEEMTHDFFDVFENTTLANLVWPYLRELFSGLTIRSNNPSFYLPLLKFLADK
jgi:preprotein translocase subunit SecB